MAIPDTKKAILVLGAVLLFVAACFAVVIALAATACGDGGSGCGKGALPAIQVVVALLGLLPATFMVRAVWRAETRRAIAWLLLALATYAFWAILNDATVHGWHNLSLI
jgi:hypothetical protein